MGCYVDPITRFAPPAQNRLWVRQLLNQHQRQASVTLLGYGFAAESQSHETAEYRAVAGKLRPPEK